MHRMSTSVAPCRQSEVTVAHCVKRDLRRWCCAGSSLFGPRSDHCVLHIRICESESRICIVLVVVFCAQEDVYVSTVNTDIGTVRDVIFFVFCLLRVSFGCEKCAVLDHSAVCFTRSSGVKHVACFYGNAMCGETRVADAYNNGSFWTAVENVNLLLARE